MSYQLQEINRRIDQDVNGFLEECDAQYAEKVSQAADAILANLPLSPIVLLSGPSGSGKTTTALKIEEELERRGVLSHTISLDNYFKTLNPKTVPRTADGSIDFESPKCLDMDLLNAHFSKLSKGETIVVPHFEFARQMRNDQMGTPLRLGKNEVAIFEGIHALNDDCAGRNPAAMCLYISARSDVLEGEDLRFKGTWMRLTRRAVRDYNFRGTGVAETLDMWANVRRGEKLYISPYKHRANYIFDSSLPYEVSVMKNYAKPMLEAVPEENARRSELLDLIHGFDHFLPIDPDLVPPASLLREFIGGGIYEYKILGVAPAARVRQRRAHLRLRRIFWPAKPVKTYIEFGSAGCGRRKCDSLRAGLRPVARLHCACGRLSATRGLLPGPAGERPRLFCDKPWALAHLNTQ